MKQLRIKAYTSQLKTENGNMGSRSEMLKLHTLIEGYNCLETPEKDIKKKNIELYKLKGIKGWLRHKYMQYFFDRKIEICYPSSKANFKDRKLDIPIGFHSLGDCKGECPVYKIFGGFIAKKDVNTELCAPSKITVWENGVITKKHFNNLKDENLKKRLKSRYNIMHFDSENSVCLGFNGESIQNFSERFVAGDFEFFIDVTKLDKEEIKVLVDVLLNTDTKLGRAKTKGCGIIEINEILYEEIRLNKVVDKNGTIQIVEQIKNLNEELFVLCNTTD